MGSRLLPTLICIAVTLLIFALMRWGWKNRQKRQVPLGTLAEVPSRYDDLNPELAVEGSYVSTTSQGDWLDRIAVETLGVKSQATLLVYQDGVIFNRQGAKDLWIPASDITAVRTEAGMSGKFVEKDGLVVLSWNFNGTPVDTGFRTQVAEEKQATVAAISDLFITPRKDVMSA